jgi:hypothetical protein
LPDLTSSERELLARCSYWLEALANGELEPLTEEQKQFVAVAQGRTAPASEHERAWLKLRPPVAPRQSAPPRAAPARLSPEDEDALRQLRGMVARREITSGFADSVLRQWEESGSVTANQLAAVRRIIARVEDREAIPRLISGGGRKPGSHRSNW